MFAQPVEVKGELVSHWFHLRRLILDGKHFCDMRLLPNIPFMPIWHHSLSSPSNGAPGKIPIIRSSHHRFIWLNNPFLSVFLPYVVHSPYLDAWAPGHNGSKPHGIIVGLAKRTKAMIRVAEGYDGSIGFRYVQSSTYRMIVLVRLVHHLYCFVLYAFLCAQSKECDFIFDASFSFS